MVTQLSPQRFDLPKIDGWAAGDNRQLSFVVTQDGDPKDITTDDIRWQLLERPYHDSDDAVLSGDSDAVDIRRDSVVDAEAGEFRVDIGASATVGLWGEYTQRVVVDPPNDTQQTWRGGVVLEDAGSTTE